MQLQEMINKMEEDPALRARASADPVETMKAMVAASPLSTDVHIYRWIVLSLGLAILISLVGGMALAFYDKDIPDMVVAIGAGALSALGALLVVPPSKQ